MSLGRSHQLAKSLPLVPPERWLASLYSCCLSQCPPGRGLSLGSWQGPDQRACSARPALHFASPPPAQPTSASPSFLLIWFLSKMITFSNNKTLVHFLTADCPHALIQRYRSLCPVSPRKPPCSQPHPSPWVSTDAFFTPAPGRFLGESLGCRCPLPSTQVSRSCFLFSRTCREGPRATSGVHLLTRLSK